MTYIRTKLRFALTKRHLCCRLSRQMEWCSPPRSHGCWFQSYPKANNLLKLNCKELSQC